MPTVGEGRSHRPHRPEHVIARALAVIAMAVLMALGAPTPGAAHGAEATALAVQPTSAAQGATIDVRLFVTNTRAVALVGFEVELPATATTYVPVAVDGWAVSIDGTTVRWAGGRVAPGGAETFRVRVGPLPSAPTVAFPASQTFDDGSVVRFDGSTPGAEIPVMRLDPGRGEPSRSSELVLHLGHDEVAGSGTAEPSTPFSDVVLVAVAATGAAIAAGWLLVAGRRRRFAHRPPT